jgi:hypothetical protein
MPTTSMGDFGGFPASLGRDPGEAWPRLVVLTR